MLRAAIIGATGIAGQQFVVALQDHPWIKIERLVGSERSAGKTYGEAIRDPKSGARRWYCDEEPLERVLSIPVENSASFDPRSVDVVFSAVESDVARELEPAYAQTTPVVSTASAFRYEDDVPILIPGVNSAHAKLICRQQQRRGWHGFVTPIPNCTTTGLVTTLKPLHDRFGIRTVVMTSMQAMSGAGRSPGVVGLDILDNVIPFIPGEEEKVQRETLKILGTFGDGQIEAARFPVSCTCTRVNVSDGHTESVFVGTERSCSVEDVRDAMLEFGAQLAESKLPSAPKQVILVKDDPFRPQPRLDRNADGGMATVVGRIRGEPALDPGVKYVLVSHNTKMGAAKGAVLVAELLIEQELIKPRQ